MLYCNERILFVKEVNPLKQGLKRRTNIIVPYVGDAFVKVVNPLKQGLKHFFAIEVVPISSLVVKEVNPLKQRKNI